jgi:hypothetical protein
MNEPGIVIYRIDSAGEISGIWTHPNIDGILAAERIAGNGFNDFTGEFTVEIFSPIEEMIFNGILKIEPRNQSYVLEWFSVSPNAQERELKYRGIGLKANSSTLVASFQKIRAR